MYTSSNLNELNSYDFEKSYYLFFLVQLSIITLISVFCVKFFNKKNNNKILDESHKQILLELNIKTQIKKINKK